MEDQQRAEMKARLDRDKAEQDHLIPDDVKEVVARVIKRNMGALIMLSKT